LGAILAASHGRRSTETIATFAPIGTDLVREAEWLRIAELTERRGILPERGAVRLLAALPPERIAIVTSATRELAMVRLSSAGIPELEVVIAAEDVKHGKPDPEGYRKAARRLAVAPENWLVVEDSPAGLLAGAAAGARVLAVATTLKRTRARRLGVDARLDDAARRRRRKRRPNTPDYWCLRSHARCNRDGSTA
jgi:sugar-phosphatase